MGQYNSLPIANTPFSAFAFKATGGNVARTAADRAGEHDINIAEMGSLGVGNDAAVIQTAIDAAFDRDITRVRIPHLPRYIYTLNHPIFQDPPGNLRGNLTRAQLLNGEIAVPSKFGRHLVVEADPNTRFLTTFET